ncbi:MAG TPA: hypothetical protein VGC09_21965 [Rhodopila sp.]
MTTGEALYLLMTLGMFLLFSVVLAYHSWQQSTLGPETLSDPAHHPETHRVVPA